jgi:hypothetical protein
MIALIIGFILPILVWILTIPLRVAVKIMEKSMVMGSKYVQTAYQQITNKESESENKLSTSKVAGVAVKVGYRVTKYSLKVSVRTLRVIIRVTRVFISFLAWLATLTSLFYTTLMMGALVSIIVIITVAIDLQNASSSDNKTSSTTTTYTGSNYMSIDWSQDFSKQLDIIQDKYGIQARNWVELTIIEMNTMQKALSSGKIQYNIPGFITGIKAVETGQTALTKTPDLTNQLVKASNGSSPMQFDTGWQKYNPFYATFNRDKKGSPYYYPDAFYGITLRFNTAAVNGFLPNRTTPIYERAFKTMGVAETTDKLRFVRYIGNITNQYNGVFLENTGYVAGLTKQASDDTVYANAMLLIEFGETYGYDINDKVINLVKSMYAKDQNDKFDNWYYNKSTAIKAIYGMFGGNKNYPSDVDKTTDYGVIDPNGNKVKGSLFNYLVNKMPAKAKSDMLNSIGLKVYNASRSHYMRARYDLTAYLCGVYDLWWASNALGVSSDVASNKGASEKPQAVTESFSTRLVDLAKRYANDTSANRITFGYTGVGTHQDSASFVNGLLRELGYTIDGSPVPPQPLTNGNLTYARTVKQMINKIKNKQELLVNANGFGGNVRIPLKQLESVLEVGDILISKDGDHTAIFVGKNAKGDYVLVESLGHKLAKSNMNLTGKSYDFGYTNLETSPYANQYNYIVRLSNVIK